RLDPTWGSITETRAPVSGAPGYRFFPHRLKGEGFYLACFRKVNGSTPTPPKSRRREKASMKDAAVVQPWIQAEDLAIMQHGSNYFAFPSHFSDEFHLLQDTLYLVYAGVRLGQVMHDKFIPDHALAVSTIRNQGIPRTPLSADDAIRYLQRRDMTIHPDRPGWQLVTFHDHPLGWINALKNRVNNYYPKEMRILKAQND
ncbi:MAG TPA: Fmu (Sun) domain protein, partial [Flavisolibacter sp.]